MGTFYSWSPQGHYPAFYSWNPQSNYPACTCVQTVLLTVAGTCWIVSVFWFCLFVCLFVCFYLLFYLFNSSISTKCCFTFRFLHNNLIRSLHRVVLLSDSSTITSLEVYIQEYFTLYQILWHCKYMLHYLMLSLFHLNWSKWSPELKDPWFPRINYAYRYPPPLVMLRVLVVLFKYSVSNKTSISTRIESLNSNTTDACVHLGFLLDL